MLRPKIKHKVKELEEIQEENKRRVKRTIGFSILFLIIILLGGSFINNYINTNISFKTQSEVDYKGLNFKLDTNKSYYRPGEKIIIYLTVSNKTKNTVKIDFFNSELAFFSVYSYVDLKITKFYYRVWTTKPRFIKKEKYTIVLKPGEKLVISKVWDQVDNNGNPVKAGVYKFVAELNIADKVILRK